MTALFINLKIDNKEKFDLFKATLSDIEHLFNECHIKIRGELAIDCLIFTKELFSDRATFYQELQENDWIAATLVMINNVKSRSIFFYLEDHKLTSSPDDLNLVLKEFDEHKLDYICYSFFRASRLDTNNLLPLNPKKRRKFSEFILNSKNIKLIKKISPLYATFSLVSISSTDYFKKILRDENKKYKFYSRKLSSLLFIIFSYPKYRVIINLINFFLSFINLRLCFNPINSPFNMEKLNIEMNIFELNSYKEKWKYGILHNELFANFDDDNNAYGESLIKRGLYPFDLKKKVNTDFNNSINFNLKINKGDSYDCTYYSQIHRIRSCPRVSIKVNSGKLSIKYKDDNIILAKNNCQSFYTNLSPIIYCIEDAEISMSIHDECFRQ
jgi:hypothetical protein